MLNVLQMVEKHAFAAPANHGRMRLSWLRAIAGAVETEESDCNGRVRSQSDGSLLASRRSMGPIRENHSGRQKSSGVTSVTGFEDLRSLELADYEHQLALQVAPFADLMGLRGVGTFVPSAVARLPSPKKSQHANETSGLCA
jgi:hypothetical protein